MQPAYHVYILADSNRQSGMLHVDMTSNLERRIAEHQLRASGFAGRHAVTVLVYAERFESLSAAVAREQQIRSWRRERTAALVQLANPDWTELEFQAGELMPLSEPACESAYPAPRVSDIRALRPLAQSLILVARTR